MSAALALPAPPGIIEGTCVRFAPFGGRSPTGMTEEGVVIEVVPPGQPVRSTRVALSRTRGSSRSSIERYVVQAWSCRVVRHATALVVVSL